MQSKQYDLCVAVLRRLQAAGVLPKLVLIGSWCLVLYREYFYGIGEVMAVRTRDMDFLVPTTGAFKTGGVDLPELLKDLGFIAEFRGAEGAMMLDHPELMIELLVPEKGRGTGAARSIPGLGLNAQPLRYMNIAMMMTLQLNFSDVSVRVPHPAAFALHKLLVAPRRKTEEKKRKDLDSAFHVLELLGKKGDMPIVHDLWVRFPATWRKNILATLRLEKQTVLAEQFIDWNSFAEPPR